MVKYFNVKNFNVLMYICCVLVVTKKSFSKSKMHGATVKKSFMGIKTQ